MAFSKKKIVEELRERTVRSFLDFLILTILTRNPSMSADDLAKYIHQKLKVPLSPGILYSHLFHLERHGLILRDHVKNKKAYRITQKGKEKIDIVKKHKNATKWLIDQILEG
ncbi:MAG: helix-turn-helix transcriptional regulator [Candidatus Bathyarchaeota archaeon]|nr:helix-turn-helix transcriptional regulator [Candidatus Bathyarchaeota archaeon]